MNATDTGIEAALAYLLTEDGALGRLKLETNELKQRYRLSDEHVDILCSLPMDRLHLNSNLVRGKRLHFLRKGLPETLRMLNAASHREVLSDYLIRTFIPSNESLETSRTLHESRQFTKFIRASVGVAVPEWARELSEFELARLELVWCPGARAAAEVAERRAAATPSTVEPLAGDELLELARHVRLLEHHYDLLSIGEAALEDAAPKLLGTPEVVTLVRHASRPLVAAFRTGPAAAAILNACSEPTQARDVLEMLARFEDPRAIGWLEEALQRGIIATHDPTRHQGQDV